MTPNMSHLLAFLLLLFGSTVLCDFSAFDCPAGWEEFSDFCYRFMTEELVTVNDAKQRCQDDGSFVLSINSNFEHDFIVNQLETYDPGTIKRDWWTSGRRLEEGVSMQFYWEGDGQMIESYFYWHDSDIPEDMALNYIIYQYDGFEWGWILGNGRELLPYICKIAKEDIFMINFNERGPDYGVPNPDAETVPRGPSFVVEPRDTIYETIDSYISTHANAIEESVYMECIADAHPPAEYEWYHESGGQMVRVDPSSDNRYTMVNGRLVIDSPSIENGDYGKYQCLATNEFGSILSAWATLDFGYINDFSTAKRTAISAPEFQFVSIPCNPPTHFPDVVYAWYKNDIRNFVRPDLKPHMFISWDGSLYFSSVTIDDMGDYYCLINKPGEVISSGKRSQPIALAVQSGNPGDYDPQIGDSFPKMFPANPLVGKNIRLECWAYGTTEARFLQYQWERVEYNDNEEVIISLPMQAKLDDHNRVLTIPDAQGYDGGTYKCTVVKPSGVSGASMSKTIMVALDAAPYFVVPLKDQFVDKGADMTWKCEAGGIPAVAYNWYRDGELYTRNSIPPEDRNRIVITNNVLTINDLREEDNGMYQCEASNSHGTAYTSGELRVLAFAPTFAKFPIQENLLATNGGNTTIFCSPEAAPQPEIVWYKNGAPLNPGTDPDSRVRQMPNGNLFITSVQSSDEGFYRCDATNEFGKANSSGQLSVLESITMIQPPMAQTVEVNKTTFVWCEASYNHQMDVTYVWYQGDMLIEFEKIYRLGELRYQVWTHPHFRRGTGLLIGGLYIMNSQYWHAGRYTCKVEAAGTVLERFADVKVIGPPSEPAGVIIVDGSMNATTARIQWKAGANNGEPILSYVIEALNIWEGFWRIMETNVQADPDTFGTMVHTLTNLRPYSEYQIRLRAENRLGTSVPSLPSERFSTIPVKPDLYPEMIGGGGGKVGDLVITWKPLDLWEENGPGIGYRIYWKLTGDDEFSDNRIINVKGRVGRHVILVGQNDYYLEHDIMVQAYNDIGDGPLPDMVTIRSAMGMPAATATNVKAQPYNSTACTIFWDPVPDTRESVRGKLGGYKLGYWLEDLGRFFEIPERVILNGQHSTGLVIGLHPDTRYYFNVYVWTEAGNGPPSTYFEQKTLRRAPINQPVEVRVTKVDDASVDVWWRGVSTTQEEEPLEGYAVKIWREGELIKNATDYDAGRKTTLHVDNLLPEETYKLRVYGYSRGGQGTMSSPAVVFKLAGASCSQVSLTVFFAAMLISIFATYL